MNKSRAHLIVFPKQTTKATAPKLSPAVIPPGVECAGGLQKND